MKKVLKPLRPTVQQWQWLNRLKRNTLDNVLHYLKNLTNHEQ